MNKSKVAQTNEQADVAPKKKRMQVDRAARTSSVRHEREFAASPSSATSTSGSRPARAHAHVFFRVSAHFSLRIVFSLTRELTCCYWSCPWLRATFTRLSGVGPRLFWAGVGFGPWYF